MRIQVMKLKSCLASLILTLQRCRCNIEQSVKSSCRWAVVLLRPISSTFELWCTSSAVLACLSSTFSQGEGFVLLQMLCIVRVYCRLSKLVSFSLGMKCAWQITRRGQRAPKLDQDLYWQWALLERCTKGSSSYTRKWDQHRAPTIKLQPWCW